MPASVSYSCDLQVPSTTMNTTEVFNSKLATEYRQWGEASQATSHWNWQMIWRSYCVSLPISMHISRQLTTSAHWHSGSKSGVLVYVCPWSSLLFRRYWFTHLTISLHTRAEILCTLRQIVRHANVYAREDNQNLHRLRVSGSCYTRCYKWQSGGRGTRLNKGGKPEVSTLSYCTKLWRRLNWLKKS